MTDYMLLKMQYKIPYYLEIHATSLMAEEPEWKREKQKTTLSLFLNFLIYIYMKSSDAKASKCHLKFSSLMIIFFYQTCIFKFSNFT